MARLQVKELAESQGMNISDLMREANRLTPEAKLSYSTVYNLWTGKTRSPNLETLEAVARALGVGVGKLFADDEIGKADQNRAENGTNNRAALILA